LPDVTRNAVLCICTLLSLQSLSLAAGDRADCILALHNKSRATLNLELRVAAMAAQGGKDKGSAQAGSEQQSPAAVAANLSFVRSNRSMKTFPSMAFSNSDKCPTQATGSPASRRLTQGASQMGPDSGSDVGEGTRMLGACSFVGADWIGHASESVTQLQRMIE
jgi:hypothetical protein